MKTVKILRIVFTCLRRGINPFSPMTDERFEKMAERLSEKEKKLFIDSCRSTYGKIYFQEAFRRHEHKDNL